MNMKIILYATIALISNLCQAEIIHRRANMNDFNSIMLCYEQFDNNDRSKLVVFPEQIQQIKLAEAIEKKRFFVAIDGDTGQVVSFLKLFIPDEAECLDILENELQAIGDNSRLMENGLYFFNEAKIRNYQKSLQLIENDKDYFLDNLSEQVIIYYGGAYTAQEYRGQGINSNLHHFAIEQIEKNVYEKGKNLSSQDYEIVFIYGQVEANLASQGILRCFAQFISNYSTGHQQFVISSFSYLASKPEFYLDSNGELEIIIPDEPKDRGQILVFKNTYNLQKNRSRTNLHDSTTNIFYQN